jgi:ATP-binding cassette subfamily B protein
MGVAVINVMKRRIRAARQLLFLLRHAGLRVVVVTVLVQVIAGVSIPLVILGSGTTVSAATGRAGSIVAGVAVCAAGLVVQQLTAPLQVALASSVQLRVDAYVSGRLIDSVGTASNLRAVEQPDVVQHVAEANGYLDQRSQTPGGASAGALALVARYTALVGTLILLAFVVSVPLALLGLVIALVNRFGQSYAFSLWSAARGKLGPLLRPQQYLRNLVIDPLSARDIRMLRLTDWLEKRYEAEAMRSLRVVWRARRRIYGPQAVWCSLATLVGSTILLAVSMTSVGAQGGVSPGSIAIVLQAALACVLFGNFFPEADLQMQYGRLAWEAILATEGALRTGPIAPGDVREQADAGRAEPVDRPADIAFEDVVYGYNPGAEVLQGVSLRLEAGKSTALVGVNGAGKSTLVKLLAGFYAPSAGRVMLDGDSLTEADRLAWQRQVAIVFQDYARYDLTLRQNIAMQASDGCDGDDTQMIRALRDVGLGDTFDALALGLDTPLSRLLPGGTDFSGGQWQRLALARALFALWHGARILVLDEPTSQMDARGEAEFYANFLKLTHGVTTLIISHRFSSVRQADTIAVLDGGRIAELGSHARLVAHGGHYARMYAAQSSRYALS